MRTALRDDVYKILLDKVISQTPLEGQKLKDTELALELGVSRVPIREAMVQLAKEGFLINEVGRGFRVSPLSIREAEELYPILIQLESLALELAAPFPAGELEDLAKIANMMTQSGFSPLQLLQIDSEFHDHLVASVSLLNR
ncbi:MAG: GntR family transcriptional regulator [Candidatus Ozemobacteraceae bacterium]